MQKHNPNCAIGRAGDLRAVCDCPLGERSRIVARLRYSAGEFRRMAEQYPEWELVAEQIEEEADTIETGDY